MHRLQIYLFYCKSISNSTGLNKVTDFFIVLLYKLTALLKIEKSFISLGTSD
jgi:hypothetical protein